MPLFSLLAYCMSLSNCCNLSKATNHPCTTWRKAFFTFAGHVPSGLPSQRGMAVSNYTV